MIIAIAIVLALLPVVIGSVRSVGRTAAILIALCSVPMVWLSFAGMPGGAAVPCVIALLVSCCATNGRDIAAKQRHAELMAALQPKPASASSALISPGPGDHRRGRVGDQEWCASEIGVAHGFATASWEDWLRSSKMLR